MDKIVDLYLAEVFPVLQMDALNLLGVGFQSLNEEGEAIMERVNLSSELEDRVAKIVAKFRFNGARTPFNDYVAHLADCFYLMIQRDDETRRKVNAITEEVFKDDDGKCVAALCAVGLVKKKLDQGRISLLYDEVKLRETVILPFKPPY